MQHQDRPETGFTCDFSVRHAQCFDVLLLVAREQRHVEKVMDRQRRRSRVGSSSAGARGGRVDKFFPGSHAPTTTQGRNSRQELRRFFLLFLLFSPSTRHGDFLCLPGLRSAQPFLRQQTNTLHLHARPHSGSEFKSTKTPDIQTTQAVYVFVPPLSTTRSSGPSQAAALSYIAKTL